ncbi:phage tail protein [Novosphingobium colocasiae]|uniref:Phage tail protein n=1 Tax=Novosphingobium colocasiae TaxID=1256513 RepID=A0A918PF29_9SPHN|nr:phage tail protein [Novosphingobium colocasiae]GGZ02741.1 hypothetical protein GCM10011614_17270 [Novosphingobium colocasiae]
MDKLNSLRAAVTAVLPELEKNPDKLRLWIERGAAKCRGTATEAFGFEFQASVLVVEMTTDIAVLMLAVFRWCRVNQPDLLAPQSPGVTFDAEILDNGSADVLLQIPLTQNATVLNGGTAISWLAEPDPLFDDGLGLGDADPVPPFAGLDVADDAPPWDD